MFTFQTSMNGYVLFEKQTLTPHPPGGTATKFPASIAVIAPLWADIDTSAGKGALYIDTFTPQSGNHSVFEEIKRNAKEHLGRSDVDFKVAMVITWKEVALYPAFIYSGVQVCVLSFNLYRCKNRSTSVIIVASMFPCQPHFIRKDNITISRTSRQ